MKQDKAKLQQVRDEVSKAIEMLGKAHAGADLVEAKRLLEEAGGAIKRDDFDRARSFAVEAQLAARPNTEYLLDRAKSLERKGSDAYGKDQFEDAIEFWRRSLEEYSRAKEIALERKENEIANGLESIVSSINRDIETAKRNQANAEMVSIVDEANKAADEAHEKFKTGEFDVARERFESARERYSKGATLAGSFGFEDKANLGEAQAEMESSIESCLLAKTEALIEAASKEETSRKEQAFSQVIAHLESFSSDNKRYDQLKQRAYKGLLAGRVEVGTRIMEESEVLLGKGEYYQAKESYRKAQAHFETLRDFAVEHRLDSEKGEIDNLIEDCTANIRVSTDALLGREGVATDRIRKVGDLRKGIRIRMDAEVPTESMLGKLRKVYRSPELIATGGFGAVFRAQTREGQIIALKVLNEPEKHQDVFFREFAIWQSLVHRNIVKLLRPRYDPVPLFEMEYVDGGDLGDLIKRKSPFSPERACRIAFDIGRGLEYAHTSSNAVHGDLKPRNILLTVTEEVKITDWGLGRIASSSKNPLGYTPGYAAPEQVRKVALDRKSDVYQLGLVLYEMLTGDNPFSHGSIEDMAEKVLILVPDKPSKFNRPVEPLDDLIMSCIEKDARNRPTVHEFREVLSRYAMENYSLLLKVTGQPRDRIGILCRNAMYAAKSNSHSECIQALRDVKSLLGEKELREIVQRLMDVMEYRQKERMDITDEVLNEIDSVVRRAEHG